MNPDVVVDVGNTRIKWGRVRAGQVVQRASLPPEDASAWQTQWHAWPLGPRSLFALAGVHPARLKAHAGWLRDQGLDVWIIDSPKLLPLQTAVSEPEKVGIDRLLNAVAANHQRTCTSQALTVDAGTAVTVDVVDAGGTFRGGTILPGAQLMAQALRDHTALLPLVDVEQVPASAIGTNTVDAIRAGIAWAVIGAIRVLVEQIVADTQSPTEVFLTGGDAAWIAGALSSLGVANRLQPDLTLLGIYLTAVRHHFPGAAP